MLADIVASPGVMHLSVFADHIIEGGAILGNINIRDLVFTMQAGQVLIDAQRVHFPVKRSILSFRNPHALNIIRALASMMQLGACVIIKPHEIQWLANQLQVARLHHWRKVADACQHISWILTLEDRVKKPAMVLAIPEARQRLILFRISGGMKSGEIESDANTRLAVAVRSQNGYRQAMSQQEVMRRLPCKAGILETRSMNTVLMPLKGRHRRLIEGQPIADPV